MNPHQSKKIVYNSDFKLKLSFMRFHTRGTVKTYCEPYFGYKVDFDVIYGNENKIKTPIKLLRFSNISKLQQLD